MTRLTVAVEQDHLERLIKRPLGGLSELLWNAVDADATEVAADVVLHRLGGVEAVEVRDNGTGITRQQADTYFSHLGGSWKKLASTTDSGRTLHGQAGQGRWAAYGLGEVVSWTSVARQVTGEIAEIRIVGRRQSLNS
ncbi:MAG: ATP-binding protein, partial [Frankia sp.]